MDNGVSLPGILHKHCGTWEGHSKIWDPETGQVVDTYHSKVEISVRGADYLQHNTYTWSDSRVEKKQYKGCVEGDVLKMDTERLVAKSRVIGPDTVIFYGSFKGEKDTDVYEIVRLLPDNCRCRTWQIVKEGTPHRVIHINERKVSCENSIPV